jgi:hypothetical protein
MARVKHVALSIEDILTPSMRTIQLGRHGQLFEAAASARARQILEDFRAIVDFEKAQSDLLSKRQAAESTARAIMLGLVLICHV